MRLINETRYRTEDLKSFFAAGLKAMGAKSDKIITVRYTRPGKHRRRVSENPECASDHHAASYASGRAHLGHTAVVGKTKLGLPKRKIIEARHMIMLMPPPGIPINYRDLALTFEHEVLHLKGVQHREMTQDQMYCRGPMPDWADSWNGCIELEPEPAPMSPEERETRRKELVEQREAKARTKLEHYESKLKRIQALCKKWRTKVRGYERRAAAKQKERL